MPNGSIPLITTVIPTHRRPKMLRRAIQSVLDQTYPHFLVCVYDNASGDETESVVAEMARRDRRIRYHRHAENIGLECNFAYGAAEVTTPFLNFLSDDDLFLPTYLETAMNSFELNPQAKMFVGCTMYVDGSGTVISLPFSRWREGVHEPPAGVLQWVAAPFGWSSAVFARTALESVGGVDHSAGEFLDCNLMLKMASRYPVVASHTLCAAFFQGGISSRTSLASWRHGELLTKRAIETDDSIDLSARPGITSALDAFIARSAFRMGIDRATRFGHLEDATAASVILQQVPGGWARARLAALFASQSIAGAIARRVWRLAYGTRSRARRLVHYSLYRRCDALLLEAGAVTMRDSSTESARTATAAY
ncbi:MAG: glycosyltransferase family 2 protein [Candidatus Binataceae bacterium]